MTTLKEVTLVSDCRAVRIPAGDEVTLASGDRLGVVQALGGSVTVRDGGGLYRIAAEDFAKLGPEAARSLAATTQDAPAGRGDAFSEEQVWQMLRQCFDPEIPLNIVDLGLIYDLTLLPHEEGQYDVAVKMTLTAPGCGMGPTIANDAREKIESLPAVRQARVDIVWDPQWTAHMISEEGRKVLGLD